MTARRWFLWHGVHVAVAWAAALPLEGVTDADRDDVRGQPAERARERLAARCLLRRLTRSVAGVGAARAGLRAAPSGRPFLDGREELGVSLSHSGGWVAAAVARRRVGVDVQVPVAATPALLRRCLRAEDLATVGGLGSDERAGRLARVWSVQEACVKATGAGFRGRPWSIPVGATELGGRFGDIAWAGLLSPGPVALSVAALGAAS
jgi:4'-phosphopantetheinyl transferase